MAVRANWHTDVPAVAADDPFAHFEPRADVQDVGQPIDLASGRPELNKQLVELVQQEQQLWNDGLRCAIKDRDDTSCSACPIAGEKGALCRVGREQERVATYLSVLQERDRARS